MQSEIQSLIKSAKESASTRFDHECKFSGNRFPIPYAFASFEEAVSASEKISPSVSLETAAVEYRHAYAQEYIAKFRAKFLA